MSSCHFFLWSSGLGFLGFCLLVGSLCGGFLGVCLSVFKYWILSDVKEIL